MRYFKQHVPVQRTDGCLDALSGQICITRFVRWEGKCGT